MPAAATPHPQRLAGVSLVELLIGLTIGLFIVGASLTAWMAHLRASHRLVAHSRLMQDLRSASDLIARDLRRIGYWGAAGQGVWSDPGTSPATSTQANPYTAIVTAASSIAFRYSRDAMENGLVDGNEQFGYRLRQGVLELQLGTSPWQAMTDIATMKVTGYAITPMEDRYSLAGSCTMPCPGADTSCPPQLLVRSLVVTLTAQSVDDTTVERSLRSRVQLRNDTVTGHCPA